MTFEGQRIGAPLNRIGELVFTTGVVGYLETLTDPSYYGQIVTHSFPTIGNYGVIEDDFEGEPALFGYIVRELCATPSNFRSSSPLNDYLLQKGIPGLCGVDTRAIVQTVREHGVMNAMICDEPPEDLIALRAYRVSRAVPSVTGRLQREYPAEGLQKHRVALMDYGVKLNIIRSLNKVGCNVTIVPYDTTAEEIEFMKPDGIFLSNGPGDPEDVTPVIEAVRKLKGKYPIFGICLGHQIIGLAYGGKTYKLKFGHHGGNHPVKNLQTGKIEITSQNHNFAVDAKSVEGTGLEVTHLNILDNTVEGQECAQDKVFSVQYHPESAPGPQDSFYLFNKFLDAMKEAKENA